MFFIFTGIVDVLLPSRVANRPKNSLRAISGVLVKQKSSDNIPAKVGPMGTDVTTNLQQSNAPDQLKKVNEISAGWRVSRYNLCLTDTLNGSERRFASQISTASKLEQVSREEQRRDMTTASGKVLSRSDIVNERAEGFKEKRSYAGLHRNNSAHGSYSKAMVRSIDRLALKLLFKVCDGFIHGVAVQSKFHLFWLQFIVLCTSYVAIVVPYQLTIDPMKRKTVVASFAHAGGLLCEATFIVDVWFSWHEVHSSHYTSFCHHIFVS
ncbi:unnamed protein product [Phytophthora lilii]|uniref:Unnamed protein product n=1 Tax=Phytophthora lilii TaxID=2077276 RepID=A0A9W6WTT5_9STRA|nr:unnamed protein product [Phytophthora lilii]